MDCKLSTNTKNRVISAAATDVTNESVACRAGKFGLKNYVFKVSKKQENLKEEVFSSV